MQTVALLQRYINNSTRIERFSTKFTRRKLFGGQLSSSFPFPLEMLREFEEILKGHDVQGEHPSIMATNPKTIRFETYHTLIESLKALCDRHPNTAKAALKAAILFIQKHPGSFLHEFMMLYQLRETFKFPEVERPVLLRQEKTALDSIFQIHDLLEDKGQAHGSRMNRIRQALHLIKATNLNDKKVALMVLENYHVSSASLEGRLFDRNKHNEKNFRFLLELSSITTLEPLSQVVASSPERIVVPSTPEIQVFTLNSQSPRTLHQPKELSEFWKHYFALLKEDANRMADTITCMYNVLRGFETEFQENWFQVMIDYCREIARTAQIPDNYPIIYNILSENGPLPEGAIPPVSPVVAEPIQYIVPEEEKTNEGSNNQFVIPPSSLVYLLTNSPLNVEEPPVVEPQALDNSDSTRSVIDGSDVSTRKEVEAVLSSMLATLGPETEQVSGASSTVPSSGSSKKVRGFSIQKTPLTPVREETPSQANTPLGKPSDIAEEETDSRVCLFSTSVEENMSQQVEKDHPEVPNMPPPVDIPVVSETVTSSLNIFNQKGDESKIETESDSTLGENLPLTGSFTEEQNHFESAVAEDLGTQMPEDFESVSELGETQSVAGTDISQMGECGPAFLPESSEFARDFIELLKDVSSKTGPEAASQLKLLKQKMLEWYKRAQKAGVSIPAPQKLPEFLALQDRSSNTLAAAYPHFYGILQVIAFAKFRQTATLAQVRPFFQDATATLAQVRPFFQDAAATLMLLSEHVANGVLAIWPNKEEKDGCLERLVYRNINAIPAHERSHQICEETLKRAPNYWFQYYTRRDLEDDQKDDQKTLANRRLIEQNCAYILADILNDPNRPLSVEEQALIVQGVPYYLNKNINTPFYNALRLLIASRHNIEGKISVACLSTRLFIDKGLVVCKALYKQLETSLLSYDRNSFTLQQKILDEQIWGSIERTRPEMPCGEELNDDDGSSVVSSASEQSALTTYTYQSRPESITSNTLRLSSASGQSRLFAKEQRHKQTRKIKVEVAYVQFEGIWNALYRLTRRLESREVKFILKNYDLVYKPEKEVETEIEREKRVQSTHLLYRAFGYLDRCANESTEITQSILFKGKSTEKAVKALADYQGYIAYISVKPGDAVPYGFARYCSYKASQQKTKANMSPCEVAFFAEYYNKLTASHLTAFDGMDDISSVPTPSSASAEQAAERLGARVRRFLTGFQQASAVAAALDDAAAVVRK